MSIHYLKKILCFAIVTITVVAPATSAQAAPGPIKEVLSSRIGWEVNKASGKICLVASEECLSAKPKNRPAGFEYPEGVAGAPNGNVYVVDRGNHRVQELTAGGEFVSMFGKGVNKKGGDVCTKAEESECQSGSEGTGAGQFGEQPASVAVDPLSGDVYVLDSTNERVEKFSATGSFLLSITGSVEHGAIVTETGQGNLLAVGGAEDLLYIGEPGRVQEFEADGKWKAEVANIGTVKAIAVDDSCTLHEPVLTESTSPTCESFDPQFGDLYVAYDGSNTIQQFNPAGQLIGEPITVTVSHTEPDAHASIQISTIATDPTGRLAVAQREAFYQEEKEINKFFGGLYEANTGRLITEFPVPTTLGTQGIGFNGKDEMFAVALGAHELLAYKPAPVAELITEPQSCSVGQEQATDVTFNCTLRGEVDPYGVPKTEVWFEWGRTCQLGTETAHQSVLPVEELLPVEASIEGLRPNEGFCYRLEGNDENVRPPELLVGNKTSFKTPLESPRIVGAPNVMFVKSASVDMFSELNPENTDTKYFFEYGTTLAGYCGGALRTKTLESEVYGKIATTLEASGLQPATTYRYRLCAENAAGHASGEIGEGEFTTAPSPVPVAVTGGYSAVGTTSATITGAVNPDGQSATYTFELGVYSGAATQYGVVLSGPAGADTALTPESFVLSGLQAGTTYAYRISVKSGYGESVGAPVTFTTTGLPAALNPGIVLPQLPVPEINFPKPEVPAVKCKRGFQRSTHNKCVKVKAKPKKGKKASTRGKRHGSGRG